MAEYNVSLSKHRPSKRCWDWVLSQPTETVIARLRENEALWDALCEEIGDNVREECATVAESWADYYPVGVFPVDGTSIDCQSAAMMREAARHIATDIRERGEDESTHT